MGNSLLDFVMALVRDPQAAAQYAADPAGALAAAGLPGVTIADVQNLIPVVTDSLATATPSFGAAFDTANVWTSGAAAAALDAFHIPHPAPDVHQPLPQIDAPAIDLPPAVSAGNPPAGEPSVDPGLAPHPVPDPSLLDHPAPEPAPAEWADGGWHHAQDQQLDHPGTEHPGFDLF